MTTLNNAIVTVDDTNVKVMPNSTAYNDGDGEVTLRPQSVGETIEVVESVNAETKIGMVKFSLLSTDENADLLRTWIRSGSAHTVTIAVRNSDFTRSFRNMKVTNNPDIELGHDANIEVEFKGERAA